ncbi:hypothetical protein AB3X31_03245 [Raoultella terrigena]|jgi:hypothetical protein|uniref:hypothetical protein n=1 Tax=Raoultella terrigena TaxID=577 RepID=UPI00349FCFA0
MTGFLPVTLRAAAGDVKNRSRQFFMTGVLPVTHGPPQATLKIAPGDFFNGRYFFLMVAR